MAEERGGRSRSFLDCPSYTAVTDVFASMRDANTVFATFNNYQRGDFKPLRLQERDRGRTWTSIAGNLPQRSGAWCDCAGSRQRRSALRRHGVRRLVHGRRRRAVDAAQGRDPDDAGARPADSAPRERSRRRHLRPRGAYILDDYSALRGDIAGADRRCRLFPLPRHTSSTSSTQYGAAWGNESTPNPPYGAVFTYHVGQAPAADAKLVLTIADDAGRPIRRLDLAKSLGFSGLRGIFAANHRPVGGGDAAAAGARRERGDEPDEPPVFGGRGATPQGAGCARPLSRHARTPRGRCRHADRRAAIVPGSAVAEVAR